MLYITVLKEPEKNYVRSVDGFFRDLFNQDWLVDVFVKDMVASIDKTRVVKDYALESPIFGMISPFMLSSGLKCLLCMYNADNKYLYRGSIMGDNCYTWLFDISTIRDVHLYLDYCPDFPEDYNVTATFVDTGVVVKNRREFVNEYFKLENIFRENILRIKHS